ncbi:hypothetical protein ACFXGT_33750 [Streptomyces sp. NPDC059352]|uniref:hypothetical protein n=1 Tax=Streptomyces sp. NPDC059352 TaxID=3346810 RepID=UPI00367B698A
MGRDCSEVRARRPDSSTGCSALADPAPHAVALELVGRARLSLAPLAHPLSPLRARKPRRPLGHLHGLEQAPVDPAAPLRTSPRPAGPGGLSRARPAGPGGPSRRTRPHRNGLV